MNVGLCVVRVFNVSADINICGEVIMEKDMIGSTFSTSNLKGKNLALLLFLSHFFFCPFTESLLRYFTLHYSAFSFFFLQ